MSSVFPVVILAPSKPRSANDIRPQSDKHPWKSLKPRKKRKVSDKGRP